MEHREGPAPALSARGQEATCRKRDHTIAARRVDRKAAERAMLGKLLNASRALQPAWWLLYKQERTAREVRQRRGGAR